MAIAMMTTGTGEPGKITTNPRIEKNAAAPARPTATA
jgi:hypothetical protein